MADAAMTTSAEVVIQFTAQGVAETEVMIEKLGQDSLKAAQQSEAAWGTSVTSLNEVGTSATLVGEKVATLGTASEEAGNRTRQSMQAAGAAMGMLGAAILGPIKEGVDGFVQMDAALRNVAAEGNLGNQTLEQTRARLNQIAEATGQSSAVMATALYKVASAGYTGSQGLDVLAQAAKTATAGQTDVATTTQALLSVLGSYSHAAGAAKLGMADLSKITDTFLGSVSSGVISAEGFASNIAKIAPVSAQMGISLREVAAAIAVLTNQGLTAEQAFNQLNAVEISLIKPSKDLAAELHRAGYASGEALIAARGFGGALEFLREAAHGSDESLAHLLPNQRALRGELSATSGGIDTYNYALARVGSALEGAGRTNEAFTAQLQTAKVQLEQAGSAMAAAGQDIGQVLAPMLLQAAQAIKNLADGFQQLSPETRQFIVIGVALTGGLLVIGGAIALLTPAVAAIGAVFGVILSPIGLAIAAIVGGAALIISNWQGISDFFAGLGDVIGTSLSNLGGSIGGAFATAWQSIGNWFGQTVHDAEKWGADFIATLANGIIMAIPNGLGGAVASIGSFLSGWLEPHSPPKILPNLDKWGAGWLKALGDGMTSGDFSFIDGLASTLTTHFRAALGPKAKDDSIAALVFGANGAIAAAVSEMEAGGKLTEAMLARIRTSLGSNSQLVAQEVEAYLKMIPVLIQINQLQQQQTSLHNYFAGMIADTNSKIGQAERERTAAAVQWNLTIAMQQSLLDQTTQKIKEQETALLPLKERLDEARIAVQGAQQSYNEIKDKLDEINTAEERAIQSEQQHGEAAQNTLDTLQLQSEQLSNQAALDQFGDKSQVATDNRAIHQEEATWHQQEAQLKANVEAARLSGDKAAYEAAKKRYEAEKANEDGKLQTLEARRIKDADVLQAKKDAEEAALEPMKRQELQAKANLIPIQQQELATRQTAQAQKDALTSQLNLAKDNLTFATQLEGAASRKYAQEDNTLTLLKDQAAIQKASVDATTIQREQALKPYTDQIAQLTATRDQFKVSEQETNTAIQNQLTNLKGQLVPLQRNFDLAKERLTVEDKIIDSINNQEKAAAAAALAAEKRASGASSKKSKDEAEKERLKPIQNEIDSTQKQINSADVPYRSDREKLENVYSTAAASGNVQATKDAKDAIKSLDDAYNASIAPLQARLALEKALYTQAKDGNIAVKDAVDKLRTSQVETGKAIDDTTQKLEHQKQTASSVMGHAHSERTDGWGDDTPAPIQGMPKAGPYNSRQQAVTDTKQEFAGLDAQSTSPLLDMMLDPAKAKAVEAFSNQIKSLALSLQPLNAAVAVLKQNPLVAALGISDTELSNVYTNYKGAVDNAEWGIIQGRPKVEKAGKDIATAATDPVIKMFESNPFTASTASALRNMIAAADGVIGRTGTTSTFGKDTGQAFVHPVVALFESNPFTSSAINAAKSMVGGMGTTLGTSNGPSTVSTGFAQAMVSPFVTLFSADPISGSLKGMITAALGAGRGAVDDKAQGAFSVGHDLTTGVATGMTTAKAMQLVINAANSVIAGALDALRAAGIIKSPSQRASDEVGQYLTQGIGVGMTNALDSLIDPSGKVIKQIMTNLKGGIQSGSSDLNAAMQAALDQLLKGNTGASPTLGAASTPPLLQQARQLLQGGGNSGKQDGANVLRWEGGPMLIKVEGYSPDYEDKLSDKIAALAIEALNANLRGR